MSGHNGNVDIFGAVLLRQCVISSTNHFVNVSFCQCVISSTCHFITVSFRQHRTIVTKLQYWLLGQSHKAFWHKFTLL
jgi:hypothetical protein